MTRSASIAAGLLAAASLAACGRPPHLVAGPIDLTERPSVVRFVQPVRSVGRVWELCFEFDLPGDSHRASEIRATLLASSTGAREPLRDVEVDRRGESRVCLVGGISPEGERTVYDAVELRAEQKLRVHGIRGGSRS